MPVVQIILAGDKCWPDLKDKQKAGKLNWLGGLHGTPIQFTALPGGMTSGLPSIALRIDIPGGRVVVAETSMQMFLTVARAFAAKYQKEFPDHHEALERMLTEAVQTGTITDLFPPDDHELQNRP